MRLGRRPEKLVLRQPAASISAGCTEQEVRLSDQQDGQDLCRQSATTSSLSIPPWVPQCLASKAHELYARELKFGHGSDAALIERLISDARMERVWQELTKRERIAYKPTKDFHREAHPPRGVSPGTQSEMQDKAILELFVNAFLVARLPGLPGSSIPYSEMAERLRRDADIAKKERPKKEAVPFAKKLISTAAAYERLAKMPVDNDQTVIIDIIEFMKARFGPSMHRITAALASVALGQPVSVDRVRDLSRRKRATKAQGKPAKKSRGKKAKKLPKAP
jgi:hypothetical protein